MSEEYSIANEEILEGIDSTDLREAIEKHCLQELRDDEIDVFVLDAEYIDEFQDHYLFAEDPEQILEVAMEFGFDDELRLLDSSELTNMVLADHFAMYGLRSGAIWREDAAYDEFDY